MKKSLFTILLALLPLLAGAVVKRTIYVATAGSLPDLISDVDKHKIEKLILTGELNGTDIKFIREMAGDSIYFNSDHVQHAATNGKLKSLNISNADIVEGGQYYFVWRVPSISDPEFDYCYTKKDSISKYMFYFYYSSLEGIIYSQLEEIILPSSVTSIDPIAFGGTGNCVKTLKVGEGNSVYDSRNNCNAIIETGTNTLIVGCNNTVIPRDVTSIGRYAFDGCSGLTSIDLPKGLTSIEDYAFRGCSGLTSVTIPNSMTSIGSYSFSGCSGLTSMTIPNSVTSIDGYAFEGTAWYENQPDGVVYAGKVLYKYKGTMPEGTKISIKDGTLSITGSAFYGCSGMTSITIPNSVTSIGESAFSYCSGLTSVTIPNSVTSIGGFVFSGCSGLTSVSIPNSVTSIDWYAFRGCSGLTSITIPNSVTSIGYYAFWGSKALTDVYCYAEAVPTTQSNSFDTSYIPNATLHVPAGSVDAYKAAEPWNQFKEIVGTTTVKVKLNKTKATLEKGKTLTLKATVTPSDLIDKSVTWESSNTKIATVSSSGKVKGVKAGTATITCTYVATGAKATCKVTVGYVKLDQTEAVIKKGKTITLTPTVYPSSLTDKSVTWESSNTAVATVTSEGKVKGVKAGTATITCTSVATGLSTTCTVTVGYVKLSKTEAYVEKGKTMTLKPTVYPSALEDKSVTWESSNTAVATVSSSGKVKGIKYGTATITCTSNVTGLSTTCKVTVGKVVISVSELSLKKSRTLMLTATVYPSSLADKSLTWESSDTKIVTVTDEGKVKGIKAGTATITCTSNATGLKGTCTVTVLSTSESRSLDGDDDETTGIEENVVAVEPFDVYDLSGHKVLNQVTSLDGLPNGIYIVNGKKVVIK